MQFDCVHSGCRGTMVNAQRKWSTMSPCFTGKLRSTEMPKAFEAMRQHTQSEQKPQGRGCSYNAIQSRALVRITILLLLIVVSRGR